MSLGRTAGGEESILGDATEFSVCLAKSAGTLLPSVNHGNAEAEARGIILLFLDVVFLTKIINSAVANVGGEMH